MVRSPESTWPQIPSQADFASLCASVCDLAVAIFDLPVAFIRLDDGTHIATGMAAGALTRFGFTERSLDAPLWVADATQDGRFFLESTVLGAPRIRFYADAPLAKLGVLGLADSRPRPDFDAGKLALLQSFASQAATLLTLASQAQAQGETIGELQARQTRIDLTDAGLGYWKIDLRTRDVTWSTGFYDIAGLTADAYRPTAAGLLDIFAADDRARLIDRLQNAVNSGQDFDVEVRIATGSGDLRPVRMRGGVEYAADGTPARLCAVVRDLPGTRPAGSDGNAAKEAFLARITDRLRTPLNDIVGFARLLDTKAQLNPDIATYTHNLLETAQSLQGLIGGDAIPETEAFPIQAPAAEAEDAIDIADLICETVDSFTDQAAARRTRLSVQFVNFTQPQGHVDVMRLQQVLRNLIANACKFTSDGVITVTASQLRTENPQTGAAETRLHVSVRDSGIGMSEDQVAGLFSGRTRGLGLSISKTIVEMLGGQIGVTSTPGEGSHIWFDMPVTWPVSWVRNAAPVRDPRAAPVPSTLKREVFDAPPPSAPSSARRPAYAPVRPSLEELAARARPPVDEDRINREYLRALLTEMKLDL